MTEQKTGTDYKAAMRGANAELDAALRLTTKLFNDFTYALEALERIEKSAHAIATKKF